MFFYPGPSASYAAAHKYGVHSSSTYPMLPSSAPGTLDWTTPHDYALDMHIEVVVDVQLNGLDSQEESGDRVHPASA